MIRKLEQAGLQMFTMKLEIITRRTIKPSSSTTQHLQTFQLSFWSEPIPVPPEYGTIIFFYQSNAPQNYDKTLLMFFQTSNSLRKSLSQTLIHYCPSAWRLKDDATAVHCNDEGAYFVEARIDCQLSTLLNHPDADFLNHFCAALDTDNVPSGCMLAIQDTLFNCGGIAITVSPSHKLEYGSSLCTFTQIWASMTATRERRQQSVGLGFFSYLEDTHLY